MAMAVLMVVLVDEADSCDDKSCICWAPADGCNGSEQGSDVRKPWVWILFCLDLSWEVYWLPSLLLFRKCGRQWSRPLRVVLRVEGDNLRMPSTELVHSKYWILGEESQYYYSLEPDTALSTFRTFSPLNLPQRMSWRCCNPHFCRWRKRGRENPNSWPNVT